MLFACFNGFSQAPHSHRLSRAVSFPDIPGYTTLSTDLHQHTVFSDGSVWPDIRVQEALKDGIDVISLTEHLEYQPHKADVPHPDRSRSYQIALQEAKNHNLMVVPGSEITRKMPPGHCNAVFIRDPNKLLISDSMGVFEEAHRQGAFVFWNHPNWTSQRSNGMATLTPMHEALIKKGWLNGIEVVNDNTYSEEALQIALEHNLTIMGTSDVHGLIDWIFEVPDGGHRPVTLVFAKDKSADAVKEGLLDRRTVVFFRDMLIGLEAFVKPLAEASLSLDTAWYIGRSQVLAVKIKNSSSCAYTLHNKTGYTFHNMGDIISIPAQGEIELHVKTVTELKSVKLEFEVMNAVTAPGKHPVCSWSIATGK